LNTLDRSLIKKLFWISLFFILISSTSITNVYAWGNGGYSDDPSNPDYGTHDWIAQHALDWLPSNEKEFILNNLATYLYGTELPDNGQASDGIGDTAKHHIYYFSNGTLQDDSSAVRASEEYSIALSYLKANDFANAAKHAGIMTHYIADMAVFGHVMGSSTDWGAEQHHSDYSDYENYVNSRTDSYNDDFNTYLSYDGSLNIITAHNAAKNLANDTTFDVDGDLTCVWMDQHYDWNNPVFKNRCGKSLNLAVNYLTDVLHTLYMSRSNVSSLNQVVINEFELNPSGNDNLLTVFEWVELYNPTASSVDISGWTLSTTHGTMVTITTPSNTTIAANGYYICERGQQWLDNTDESIILKNSKGVEIDRTPTKSDDNDNNFCWARFPNGYDTNSSSDWRFQLATKGASNGKASSLISCGLSSTSLEIGSSITVSGAITPSHSSVTVILTYTKPDGSNISRITTTNSTGGYQDTYTLNQTGSWKVQAKWNEDSDHYGAIGSSVSFIVSKISSSISCSVSSTSIDISSNIIVSGSITPARPSVTVTLSYKNDTSWNSLATVTSSSNGNYSYTWTPASVGSYQLKASWDGDSAYDGATSSVVSVTVAKISTTISCSVSPSELTKGNSVTVSGSINPAVSGKTITLTYRKPDGSIFNRTITTGSNGRYSDSYTPDMAGSWSVKASWEGDSERQGAYSQSTSFNVKKKGICIIATATYGSELSPEVQFLRKFRDQEILSTFAGSQFMVVFNQFYYSFSPSVASLIADNPVIRSIMKAILYPLIGILHLASMTYSIFSFSPELAVVISGLVASALIGIIYLTPVLVILLKIKRAQKHTLKTTKFLSFTLVGSLILILVSEFTYSSTVMMLSTGTFVLTTLSLSALFTYRITKLLGHSK